jgi:iron complex transport system substrate-binding protein
MGQPRFAGIVALAAIIFVAALLIQRRTQTAPPISTQADVRVASVTPAGTDLLVGIGAGDRLVGVSNFDDDREGIAGKPRIGDYRTIDWEKLSTLRPNVLLLQYAPDRIPTYLQQQCAVMGIRIVNLKLDTVDEICNGMMVLGDAMGEPAKAHRAVVDLRGQLDSVASRVKRLPPVRTLIVTNDQDFSLAGPGEFLDELLRIAGGVNAAASLGRPYPAVDREMILKLAPDLVIRLVPNGDEKPQVIEQGDKIWQAMPDLPAVKNHRVYVLTEWYSELPGFRIGDLVENFARILHPEAAGGAPGTRPS